MLNISGQSGDSCFISDLRRRDFSFSPLSTLAYHQFSSVAQSCLTLFDPKKRSTPSLPVHHQLPECTKLMSIKLVMTSNHLILCHPLLLQPSIFPSIKVFSNGHFLTSGGQNIGFSDSASLLSTNIED